MNAGGCWFEKGTALAALGSMLTMSVACDRKPKDDGGGFDAAALAVTAPDKVPPIAPLNGVPLPELDAGNLDDQSPFEQAKVFESNGQLWMGRLVLEKKALGADGTKEEAELLAKICQQQSDETCLDACSAKLGRKIKFDASAPPATSASARTDAGRDTRASDTELARARDLFKDMQFAAARKTLEPKVLDGRASRDEIRLLRSICEKQSDRMCIALCDAKLK